MDENQKRKQKYVKDNYRTATVGVSENAFYIQYWTGSQYIRLSPDCFTPARAWEKAYDFVMAR